jgi:DNA-binding NtrC family response regulator
MEKILVIENDTALCWLLGKVLKTKYKVISMSDGLEASAWLSEGNTCDLIISDVNMPMLDGVELLENIKSSQLLCDTPVIILSGLDDSREKCLELGAYSFLVKPFEPQKLLALIDQAITLQREAEAVDLQ